jgi:glycine/serine hydroxymethyltransferase
MFFGGIESGELQLDHTVPLLQDLSKAQYVDVRPLSGLNCMAIVMSGLCESGDLMYTVPESWGGHMSTRHVAQRFGIRTKQMGMIDHELDLEALASALKQDKPRLIYIDQSTELFPIDPKPIKELIERYSSNTFLHYDSSHNNGLILGEALPNPLERGADSFGGSTHKTFPGPHKAFIATNSEVVRDLIEPRAYHMVSHHQPAAVASLGITLFEFRDCGGAQYAKQVLINSRRFAKRLHEMGILVAASERGFTDCHQVWTQPAAGLDCNSIADALYRCGLLVNKLPGLPTLEGPALRLSLAEFTRMGGFEKHVDELAGIFAAILSGNELSDIQLDLRAKQVEALRAELPTPSYCYTSAQLRDLGAPAKFIDLLSALELDGSTGQGF